MTTIILMAKMPVLALAISISHLKTFYRWKRRYDPSHLESLEDRSHCPRNVRKPQAPPELVEAVLKIREEYPCRGKEKIAMLLREQGFKVFLPQRAGY